MSAYNTQKKEYGELKRTLVGRGNLVKDILGELNLKKNEAPKQQWMLVGPRGIGKSHILTLLFHEVKRSKTLKNKWIPVLFPEELRRVSTLAQFLERGVHELASELKEEGNEIYKELKEKGEKAKGLPPEDRAEFLFSVLDWLHEESGRHILFLTENLQHLLGKKIKPMEQKKMRAYLQKKKTLLLLGSATTVFKALHDSKHPFYHYFHIQRLKDLSFDEVKTLLKNLLREKGDEEEAAKLEAIAPRRKALFAFTGGNPRMTVFLRDILKIDFPDEMLPLMDNILEELTPYFNSLLKDVPDHLEGILNVLAEFEPAQSPSEIANRLEASPAIIRNYIKELKKGGYVKIAFSKGKSNYYCLNEYLYRLWYQMRDSGHREDTRWLIELLLMLYTPSELSQEDRRVGNSSHEKGTHNKAIEKYKKSLNSNRDTWKQAYCWENVYSSKKNTRNPLSFL